MAEWSEAQRSSSAEGDYYLADDGITVVDENGTYIGSRVNDTEFAPPSSSAANGYVVDDDGRTLRVEDGEVIFSDRVNGDDLEYSLEITRTKGVSKVVYVGLDEGAPADMMLGAASFLGVRRQQEQQLSLPAGYSDQSGWSRNSVTAGWRPGNEQGVMRELDSRPRPKMSKFTKKMLATAALAAIIVDGGWRAGHLAGSWGQNNEGLIPYGIIGNTVDSFDGGLSVEGGSSE